MRRICPPGHPSHARTPSPPCSGPVMGQPSSPPEQDWPAYNSGGAQTMTDRPFDISVKDLAEQDPLSWCRLADSNTIDTATVIDADVSTVTASADKVLRAEGPRGTWLVNMEAASTHDAELPGRLHLKSVMLEARHHLPVRSVVILLRRAANARAVSGTLRHCLPGERKAYNTFRYEVVRLWQMPLEPLLTGG